MGVPALGRALAVEVPISATLADSSPPENCVCDTRDYSERVVASREVEFRRHCGTARDQATVTLSATSYRGASFQVRLEVSNALIAAALRGAIRRNFLAG